jgi:hypothetical protein
MRDPNVAALLGLTSTWSSLVESSAMTARVPSGHGWSDGLPRKLRTMT